MGIIDWLKKTFGIGQPFDVTAYIDPKWLNPPEVVHPPHGLTGGSSSGKAHELEANTRVETHWWRHCAERELPDAGYYIENFSEKQLRELVIANLTGHDISVFADPQQTPDQLRYIYMSAEAGEDIS